MRLGRIVCRTTRATLGVLVLGVLPLACASGAPKAEIDQRTEAPLPEPRQEVASAADENLGLWVVGGFDPAGRSSASVFRYDGRAWARQPDLPLGLDHPAAAMLDGVLYVAGGNSSGTASARLFALPGPRALAAMRHPRAGLALVAAAGKLYAIGGIAGGTEVGPAEEYDPAADRWTPLPPLPNPRDHVAGFAHGGKACVAGGRSPNSAAVDCWDPAGRRWTSLTALPTPTSGAGGGALGGRVIVAGGEDGRTGSMIDQLAVLDGDEWRVDRMREPRHGVALAAYRGRLWACGGGTVAGLRPVATCTSIG
jgi:non-specific serine/threonine protein kinase